VLQGLSTNTLFTVVGVDWSLCPLMFYLVVCLSWLVCGGIFFLLSLGIKTVAGLVGMG
jgi:hypothetical protein